MRKLFSGLKREEGNILLLFAVSLTVVVAMVALVIDGGRFYHEKSILQNAVDAAALGGAQELLTSPAEAESKAIEYAAKNNFPIDSSNVDFPANAITVTIESVVQTTFAKVLGIDTANIHATATAALSPLTHKDGVTPIAVEKDAIPTNKLNCATSGTYSGNCGFLNVEANGANALKEAIINGAEYETGVEDPDTNPGRMQGPVQKAVEELISKDASKDYCQSPETAIAAEEDGMECARLITVAVVETLDVSGSKQITIIGFAHYYLVGMAFVEGEGDAETITMDPKGDRIIGEFITTIPAGSTGEGSEGSYEDYLLQGSKLIK